MARPLDVDWHHDEETLCDLYKQETDHQNRMRLHGLWLLRRGEWTLAEVADILGVAPSTVSRWLNWYRAGGVDEVLSHRHGGSGGREPRLSPEQEAQLLETAEAGDLRTIWDGVAWAQEQCDVEYTYWGMRHVFERLGLTKQVPRPASPEASAEEQAAWKNGELTAKLEAADLTSESAISFADEMRVGLMGQVRRVWAPRGATLIQEREFAYEWAYLNLAVDVQRGEVYWDWTENMQATSIAPNVQDWAAQGLDAVVWDQAPGHGGTAYDTVELVRIQQPAYSPELNPAERIFEELRARVEGEVYGTLEAKQAAVETELEKLAADPERVKRLAGWDWIQSSIDCLSETRAA